MLDLALPLGYGFLLVLLRTAGLCLTAPVLSMNTVPARLRLAVALAVGFAVFCGAGMPHAPPPQTLLALASASLAETAVGASAGLCARFLMDAAQAAGSVAGLSAGLGYGAMVDPINGAASSVGGQLFAMLALGLAVAANLHGEAIGWLARSVASHPPGGPVDVVALASTTVATAIAACTLAVRLSFPFLTASLISHAALGVLNRATPQLSISSIGFSISLAAGGVAIYLVAPTVADAAARAAISFFAGG